MKIVQIRTKKIKNNVQSLKRMFLLVIDIRK